MSVSLIALIANMLFFLVWLAVELRRRYCGILPEVPLALILVALSLNALSIDNMILLRLGAFAALSISVYEAREFVRVGAAELSLAGTVASGVFGAAVLTYWAVSYINEHLNLAFH